MPQMLKIHRKVDILISTKNGKLDFDETLSRVVNILTITNLFCMPGEDGKQLASEIQGPG